MIDYDDALLPDGTWHHTVGEIYSKIPEAAMEVSHSGKGAHNWCAYQGELPAQDITTVNIGGLKVELFLANKFIALGNQETAKGDAGTDYTAALVSLVAQYFKPDAGRSKVDRPWTSEPDLECKAPDDDDEVLKLFLKGRAGKTPTNLQLWEGDLVALAKWKPEPGRADGVPFNPTAGDALMAGEFNFYGGNNYERTLRLMERSPYSEMRTAKWADGVLRRETIPNTHSAEVYQGAAYFESQGYLAGDVLVRAQ